MRRQFIKFIYPVFAGISKMAGKGKSYSSNKMAKQDFYSLSMQLNNGREFSFENFRGKKVLIVNTASDCGYTPQYKALQALHEQQKDHLFIIGFPSNDFGEQEKGSDAQIEQFCQVNYGVSFPLAKKAVVVKGGQQHPVYQWLTDENKNGWNYTAPDWNFCKYLVDENGNLTHFFQSAAEPLGKEIAEAIEQKP